MAKKSVNYKKPQETDNDSRSISGNVPTSTTISKKINIKCKNAEQKEFINLIDDNEIILCNGPAGCGKTFLSIIKAVNFLNDNKMYKKIYIITPTVSISRSPLGHLPGTFEEKISVYINSIFRLFDKIISEKVRKAYIERGIIEIMSIDFIRGENLDDGILIVDEAQNVTIKEMLTILTRIGENCKMIISGDSMQIDKLGKSESGLNYAMEKLDGIKNIGVFTFSPESVVRNGIIMEILKKWY